MTTANSPLEGRCALVTGGAKRVGRAIAIRLAEQGMDVAVTYRSSAAEAAEVVGQIEAMGRRAVAIQIDFAEDTPSVGRRMHGAFCEHFDRLDALVNNASIFDRSPLVDFTAEAFAENMNVNALAPMLLMQAFAPMLADGADVDRPQTLGRVVNFIDIHVMGQPLKGYLAYNASKAALMEATMTLAMELAPHATVNALAPGVVAWAESYTQKYRDMYMRRVPLARPGTPDDAADAAIYLIRDAHYCTGQIIRLDGGRLLT